MWIQTPPPVKKSDLTPLLRPRPGQNISGRLCGEPLRVFLHFTSGRSWPCVGRGCCLCKREVPRRYYAYYPIRNDKGKLGILEMTSQVEDDLSKQMNPVTQVTSGHVCLYRPIGRRNMPCSIEWSMSNNNGESTVENIEVRGLQGALCRIWNLPCMNQDLDESEWLETINNIIDKRTGSSAQPR